MKNHTYDFVVTLQRSHTKAVNLVSQILLAIFLAAFVWFAYRQGLRGHQWWLLINPLLVVILWAYGYVRAADPTFEVNYRTELAIAAMCWLALPLAPYASIIGMGYAVMAVMERLAKRPMQYRFTEEYVVRNSLPEKKYEWFEIANVMIRDNLFTLDLNNNKIIQRPLETAIDEGVTADFNAYCQQHLHFNIAPGANK